MDSKENNKDRMEGGADDPLLNAAVWALDGVVKGVSKLCNMRDEKKWKAQTSGMRVGDLYTGTVNVGLNLEISALKGVRVDFLLASRDSVNYIDDSEAEPLRACWGEENRLSSAVKIAKREGLDFDAINARPWNVNSSSKMVRLFSREEVLRSVLVELARDSVQLDLRVACKNSVNRTVWFYCDTLELMFFKRIQAMCEGVEAAIREHVLLSSQRIVKGEIVRHSTSSRKFDVRLEGVSFHDVRLSEPAWDEKQRYQCLATGYFDDYICENWLRDHEFRIRSCIDDVVNVTSETIDNALGISQSAYPITAEQELKDADQAAQSSSIGNTAFRIIVDASNVVRADPKLSWMTLRTLVSTLAQREVDFVLMFDANIAHVLEEGGVRSGVDYIRSLECKYENRLLIVPAGVRADEYILFEADKTGAHILSRDRYRDQEYRARYKWLAEDVNPRRVHKFAILDSCLIVPDLDIREKIVVD